MPIIVSKDELDNLINVINALKMKYRIFQVNDINALLHKNVDELFPPVGDPSIYIYVLPEGKGVKMILTEKGLLKSYS